MAEDLKQQLLGITLKHIQGRVFEADEYYKALEPLGAPASYAETLVDVFWLLWVRFEGGRGPESMNLVAAIKACWQDKRVPEKALLQVLEPDCLHSAGLVRDKGVWDKKAVRYNTRLNYTILKYNLLREDSEGYAKLVTLYNHFGAGAVGEQDLPSLARELHALIGSFDLDPNRCLDLLLDAAAAQPGNGALLGAVGLLKAEAVGQLMGFKLQQYQDPSRPPAPRNLLLVAAELIRSGRTTLAEILAHLAPSDEAQLAGQRAAKDALQKRVAEIGQINLGGAGGGEGGDAAAAAAAQQPGLDPSGRTGRTAGLSAAFFELDPAAAVGPLALGPAPQHNQPLALLDALLQVGAWDAASELHDRLVALGSNPAAHVSISTALCGLLAEEVAPAYGALFPQGVLGRNALWGDVPPSGAAAPALSARALKLLGMLGLYIHRDTRLFTKIIRLVRFQLAFPAAASLPDAATLAAPSGAAAAGPRAGSAGSAAASASAARPPSLEELLSGVLLPAVACCPVALPLAAELWECVKLLPVASRYRIYADYRDLSQSHPLLQASWRLATVETKKVLKRLVLPTDPQKKKEACRPHARMVAKVAHANPLPVMEAIVTQIEVYDNQIEVSLEALKYLSPFSYDVLTFVILSRLALERDKVKEDGVNISGWLQGLARFTGAACRRFSDLDVGAVLQFLVNTLRAGDAFDLLVLQQIIVAMTGVRLEAVLSDDQLDAISGGPELVAEAVVLDAGEADAALGMGRVASAKDLAKGRQRLLRALEEPDGRRLGGGGGASSLTLPLLILVAQQRSIIINHTDSRLIKFIATMYDRCQDTLLHLTEFLRLAVPLEAYADMLPGPDVLRREFGIDVEAVWHMYRPVMSRLLDAAAPQPAEEGELEEGEDGGQAAGPTGDAAAPREESRVGDKTWAGVLSGLPACAASPGLWSVVTPEMYATFWSLQLTDIYVPVKRYEKELSAVKDGLQALESRYVAEIRPGLSGPYVSNNTQTMYESYKADKAVLQEKQQRLSRELESRQRHVEEVRTRLALQRAGFFLPRQQQQGQGQQAAAAAGAGAEEAAAANGGQKAAAGAGSGGAAAGAKPPVRTPPTYQYVVQEMLLPRLLFSAADALYCARLLLLLHSLETKHFSLIVFLDSALRAIVPVLRSLTEVEASNFGVFLFELLKQLVAWHRDEKLFTEECVRKVPNLAALKQPHNIFKSKMMMWHGIISATFRASIESGDYTQIANALSVMGRLVSVWPGTIPAANSFRAWVEKLQKEDPREDIKTMARSYVIALNRESDKPGRMMSQVEYGGPSMLERQKAGAAAGARGGPAGSSPPGTAAKGGPRQGGGGGASQAAAGTVTADGGAPKQLSAAAKPFVPKTAGGEAASAGGGDVAMDGRGGSNAGGGTARKRPRTEGGRADGGDKAADAAGGAGATSGAAADKAAAGGGAATADGGGKKQRTEVGGAAATAADDKAKARGGGGGAAAAADRDRDTGGGGGGGADTFSDAGGRAGSETSGRDGGRDGKPEKEHKEHKRSKDKDREKERGGKERKADKGDKEHREEKDDSRREEKERRREEKERERAEKAAAAASTGGGGEKSERGGGGVEKPERSEVRGGGGGGGGGARAPSAERSRPAGDGSGAAAGGIGGASDAARDRSAGRDRPPRDRHGGRRSGAVEDGADRDGGGGDGGSKRRRVDGKADGGGSPGHTATAVRVGSSTPEVGGRRAEGEMEYDERGGFALPPAPAPRGGGGGSGGTASARGGSGGSGGGGLPPPARSNGAGDARRRSGR